MKSHPGIRIEGAIFSPDILERLEDLRGQRPADFGLETGLKVKDEIARAWADAQDYWRIFQRCIFQRRLAGLRAGSPATTETRQQWIGPLLGLLGYQLEYRARGEELNGKLYPISHRVTNRGQLPVDIMGYCDEAGLDRKPENATRRMSAHARLQEFINLDEQLYAIATNGRILRLLRDSSRLIKLTYLEFDLDRIFTDGIYSDFAVLYRLLHVTRLPQSTETAPECLLEQYHQDSLESGARIREGLSAAVKSAIKDFANGFIQHPDNDDLRADLRAGKPGPEVLYHQLLRLIYRLLFLMVVEERGLVFPSEASPSERTIYERYYSVARLRRLSERPYLAESNRHDYWLSLLATFTLFEDERHGGKLGLHPLGGDLFKPSTIGLFRRAHLANDVLARCLRALGLYQHKASGQTIRVNYAGLNVEELGSIYEGLLELKPALSFEGSRPTFSLTSSDQRAATGSHYTPDELVQPLIRHSLDYLIEEKLKEPNPAAALLSLRVADISCGSGHILLAAARRIATELAIVETGEEQPSPSALRSAMRKVIRSCIYGVDLNPLAVELCKVALWLEAHSPGEPLNFLDHHIKCGNAIVGCVRREELEEGIPDEAFATMPGDDKQIAARYRRERRKRQKEEPNLAGKLEFAADMKTRLAEVLKRSRAIAAMPERTPAEIDEKQEAYRKFSRSEDTFLFSEIAAIPIAQFYIPKTKENMAQIVSDADFKDYLSGFRRPQGQATAGALARATDKRFFHWFLEFPEIIDRGGFDCILGNPPYLGGQALSGTYGHEFCHYVKWKYAPTGLSELVVFFVRRIYSLLSGRGFAAFITTNSIKDGDIRKDGLEQIMSAGGGINFAIRGTKWPGAANLVVALLALHKGEFTGRSILDSRMVAAINPYLESGKVESEPTAISSNAGSMFQGSIFSGDGFLRSIPEAERLITEDTNLADVILPVINGRELNNAPDQAPGRYIINFRDWPLSKAQNYHAAIEILEREVKPWRDNNKRLAKIPWWQFERPRLEVYRSLAGEPRCFIAARTTKHLSFSASPTNRVFSDALYIFTTSRWDLYAIVQCTLHEVWARKYSGALETRLRYSPSNCFYTFPFPGDLWNTDSPNLADIGERYHEHRRSLMLSLWLGLTDIYNLFHDPELTPEKVAAASKKSPEFAVQGYEGLLTLRRLHRALDEAVRDAYGWASLDLEHDFHEVDTLPENDRVRYTISPAARKKVLSKLLSLNLERAKAEQEAEEKRKAAENEAKGKAHGKRGKGGGRKKKDDRTLGMFGEG